MPGRDAVPRPPRPGPVHPPHRRRPRRRRVRPALQPGLPLGDAFCSHMAEGGAAPVQRRRRPRRLRRGSRCSARRRALLPRRAARALRRRRGSARSPRCRARARALQPRRRAAVRRCSRACSPPSSSARATSATCAASTTSLRDQARGMGAVGRVAARARGGEDARQAVCGAACEVAGAPVAFLLEPTGREFVSTAMAGVEIAPVTIQPRGDGAGGGAFTAKETLLRRRRAQPPGARRAARRGDRRALRAVRAGAARRPGRRRADRHLAACRWRRCPTRPPACCGCSRRRPRSRSSTPALRARVAGAGAERPADRPRHPARVGGGAAARDRARPPLATRRCRSRWSTSTT